MKWIVKNYCLKSVSKQISWTSWNIFLTVDILIALKPYPFKTLIKNMSKMKVPEVLRYIQELKKVHSVTRFHLQIIHDQLTKRWIHFNFSQRSGYLSDFCDLIILMMVFKTVWFLKTFWLNFLQLQLLYWNVEYYSFTSSIIVKSLIVYSDIRNQFLENRKPTVQKIFEFFEYNNL